MKIPLLLFFYVQVVVVLESKRRMVGLTTKHQMCGEMLLELELELAVLYDFIRMKVYCNLCVRRTTGINKIQSRTRKHS